MRAEVCQIPGMKRLCAVYLASVLFACATPAFSEGPVVELVDVAGKTHQPLVVPAEKKAAVLFFVSPYCPTANKFLPEINQIAADHGGQFEFYLVHADPQIKKTDAYQQAEMFEVKISVLLDEEQVLAKLTQAKITPEAVVWDRAGKVVYQGRINDLYLGPTKRQRQATTRDLRDALEALAVGKAVPVAKTEAMGCKIPGASP